MKRRAWLASSASILIVAILADACGSNSGKEDAVPNETDANAALVISRIEFGDSSGVGGTVEVTNIGDVVAEPERFHLCQLATCLPVPPAPLKPGESMWITSDETRTVGPGEQGTLIWQPGLAMFAATGGEFSLHQGLDIGSGDGAAFPTVDWDAVDPALVSYVAWGSSEQILAPDAVRAGLWVDGGAVDSAGAAQISALSDAPTDPADWEIR